MKKVYLIFILVFITKTFFAQIINSSICDSTNRFAITHYVSILRSKTLISFDSVLVLNTMHKFTQAENKPVLVFNYDPYYYWFRIIIKNSESYSKDLMLLMAPIGMRDGELFQKRGSKWESIVKTGIKYKFEERPYLYTHFVFPFRIPANSYDTLFLSTDASNVYKSYGFALIKPKALKAFENQLYFLFGIIVGLLLLFCILNVSLFFALKDEIHLWYAGYIALIFLAVMKNDHLDQQFLNWDSESIYRVTPLLGISAVAISILMHVVQRFLVNIKNSVLYKISFTVKINVLISGIAHFIFFFLKADFHILSFVFYWAQTSILLSIVTIIIDCIFSISRNFKSAFFILAGLLLFLIGVVQRMFFPSTLSFLFPPSTFHFGIITETFIISLGLIYQYGQVKKEDQKKEKLLLKEEEAKQLLVKEKKALENSLLESKLEIQEQTFQNISQEIHDNIGQVLSLAKLNLNTLDLNLTEKENTKIRDATDLLTKAIQDLRDLSKTLNADTISTYGLTGAIETELQLLQKTGVVETSFEINGRAEKLNPQKELILFRIIQESLQNIIKHAKASKISVIAYYTEEELQLMVIDNGQGFDILGIDSSGSGMKNIKSRCSSMQARFEIISNLGNGTKVIIRLPLKGLNIVST